MDEINAATIRWFKCLLKNGIFLPTDVKKNKKQKQLSHHSIRRHMCHLMVKEREKRDPALTTQHRSPNACWLHVADLTQRVCMFLLFFFFFLTSYQNIANGSLHIAALVGWASCSGGGQCLPAPLLLLFLHELLYNSGNERIILKRCPSLGEWGHLLAPTTELLWT